jgi:hypothetical protein
MALERGYPIPVGVLIGLLVGTPAASPTADGDPAAHSRRSS